MTMGLSHVGIAVKDLEASISFYRAAFALEVLVRRPFGGALYERILAIPGVRGQVALLRRETLQVELFEFNVISRSTSPHERAVSECGISHFCIEVADIEAVYERALASGAVFHCPPLDFGEARATYGRDPDGNVFELWQSTRVHAAKGPGRA